MLYKCSVCIWVFLCGSFLYFFAKFKAFTKFKLDSVYQKKQQFHQLHILIHFCQDVDPKGSQKLYQIGWQSNQPLKYILVYTNFKVSKSLIIFFFFTVKIKNSIQMLGIKQKEKRRKLKYFVKN